MSTTPNDCCICEKNYSLSLSVCLNCLEDIAQQFSSTETNATSMQPTCSFCRPILPMPGAAPMRVVEKGNHTMCATCSAKYLKDKRAANTGKVIPFPKF